jgi:hypothetical protein
MFRHLARLRMWDDSGLKDTANRCLFGSGGVSTTNSSSSSSSSSGPNKGSSGVMNASGGRSWSLKVTVVASVFIKCHDTTYIYIFISVSFFFF